LLGLRDPIVLASPLPRAHETATAIASVLSAELVIIAGLAEIEDGELSGAPMNAISDAVVEDVLRRWEARFWVSRIVPRSTISSPSS